MYFFDPNPAANLVGRPVRVKAMRTAFEEGYL